MGGNREQGFLRGNRSGRNGTAPKAWYCLGCDKEHGGQVNRTLLSGNFYCDRKYLAIKEKQFSLESERRKADLLMEEDSFKAFAQYSAKRPQVCDFETDSPAFYCWYEYGGKPRAVPLTTEQLTDYLTSEKGYDALQAQIEASKVARTSDEWAWYNAQIVYRNL